MALAVEKQKVRNRDTEGFGVERGDGNSSVGKQWELE